MTLPQRHLRHVQVWTNAPKSYLFFSTSQSASAAAVCAVHLSDCVAEQTLQIHTIGPLRPGVLHSPKNQSAKTHLRLQANLARSLLVPPFPVFVFHSTKKISGSSLVFCSTLAALPFFFHYLVRFSSSSSSSLCLPLHRSHHQLFLLLLLLLLPLCSHWLSAFSASRP